MTLSVSERAKRIRLVVLDIDGVMTDGSIWTGENGESVKRFHVRDGLGIKMLQGAGIPVAIYTAAGRLVRQVQTTGYVTSVTGLQPGIYVAAGKKVVVK